MTSGSQSALAKNKYKFKFEILRKINTNVLYIIFYNFLENIYISINVKVVYYDFLNNTCSL